MKVILTIIGFLLIFVGIVWFLQGINVLPGSFMSGQIEYAFAGVVAVIAGIGLIVYTRRRKSAPAAEDEKTQDAESAPAKGETG
jgi:uncharacterized membrane protein HdeD (DUF308 family)